MRNTKCVFCLCMTLALLISFCSASSLDVQAEGNKVLSMYQAKSLAIAKSDKIEELEIQLEAKKAAKESAVKSIALKKKKMSTISWSPLFSITWPTQATQEEAYEFTFKPISLQNDINLIEHEITDQEFEETKEVYNLFVSIVVGQETIDFNQDRLDNLKESYTRNQARILTGEASQDDLDKINTSIQNLTSTIATEERTLQTDKKNLSKMIGLDVTTNYDFTNPFVDAEVPYDMLEEITEYTLDHDQEYYEACIDESQARSSLTTYYELSKEHYSQDEMSSLDSFVQAALNGQDVSRKAFNNASKEFLEKIDEPWEGSWSILFFKIPKVWIKDEDTDGTNYISDEPKSIYSSAMEYISARKAKDNAAETLKKKVEDAYNTYVTLKNTYIGLKKQAESQEEKVNKAKLLNEAGELSYDDYQSIVESYEETEQDMLDALAEYSQNLYEFDRLSCGRVSEYLYGTSATAKAADGGLSYMEDDGTLSNDRNEDSGLSYVEEEVTKGAYYYVESIVQSTEFRLHVYIPEDFGADITDYELWVDDTQIGSRVNVDTSIRHLGLDLDGAEKVFLRFYNGTTFVDDVEIDPSSYSGSLDIVTSRQVKNAETTIIGNYKIEEMSSGGYTELEVNADSIEGVSYYRIKTKENKYLRSDKTLINSTFTYLSIFTQNMDELEIEFYDDSDQLLTSGYFNTADLTIRRSVATTEDTTEEKK